jgi:hypothetical protein
MDGAVRSASDALFRKGANLSVALAGLRKMAADAMRERRIQSFLQEVVLAEITTTCVITYYSSENRRR